MFLWSRCFLILLAALGLQLRASAAPFEDSMAQRLLACTACHGAQGRAGPDGYYPRLAGKPAGYLLNQLRNFREGRRHYALMTGLLDTLDDAYLQQIAAHFAAQSPPFAAPQPAPATAGDLERGRKLVQEGNQAQGVPACSQCHGLALTGVNPATPGLLGLPADYLNAQLGGWQTGQRAAAAPDCMATIAKRLSAADISAIARWLSAQPVPPHAHAVERRPAASPGTDALRCGSDAAAAGKGDLGRSAAQAATATATAAGASPAGQADAALLARGRYLARIGNCALCHSARGSAAYAGGRALDTPFGTVYSSNLTPDPVHGIGRWSADDFWRALHQGLSQDGHALYPVFPYPSYSQLSRADSDALFRFLQSLPAAGLANQAHALRWPVGTQPALLAWRALFFRAPAQSGERGAGSAALQRGRYLVQGLGHCLECHGQRNALGALTQASDTAGWAGSVLPGSLWFAPALTDPASPMAQWSEAELADFLQTGSNGRAWASGPMAEVVLHGTQYLTDADARAMALYLKTLPRTPATGSTPVPMPAGGTAASTPAGGAALYEKHCADCHGLQGQGRANAYPALAGNPAVLRANSNNLVHLLLEGGFAPATARQPRPYGMPPFVLQLSDREIAAVLSYIRSAWGNRGTPLNEFDINKLRRSLKP